MTDAEWQSVNLQEALRFVNFAPETRKSDLLTVACARTVWTGLRQRLQKEILAIEAHADNPSIPGANVGTLIEGSAWFKSSASKRMKETEGLSITFLARHDGADPITGRFEP